MTAIREERAGLASESAGTRAAQVLLVGWQLFLRDFRYRYRMTYLGYFWAFFRVLIVGVPVILVGRQFNLGGGKTPVPYEAFAFLGLITWQIFWDAVVFPQWIMRRVRKIIRDVSLPYLSIPVAGCCYVLFNTSLYAVMAIITFMLFRLTVPLTLPLALLAVPGLILAGLSIGIFFIPITLVYLDVRYSLPLFSTALLWTAPIFYTMPERGVLRTINIWNPLTYLIGIPRDWLVGGSAGGDLFFWLLLVPFLLLLLCGVKFLDRAIPIAAERIV